MKIHTESVVLQNEKGQKLRIYQIDGVDTFCIGEEESDHFEFKAKDAEEIIKAIQTVVYTS